MWSAGQEGGMEGSQKTSWEGTFTSLSAGSISFKALWTVKFARILPLAAPNYILLPSYVCFHVTGCVSSFILIVAVCVSTWPLLSYNEQRQVKCRITFQFAPETSIWKEYSVCVSKQLTSYPFLLPPFPFRVQFSHPAFSQFIPSFKPWFLTAFYDFSRFFHPDFPLVPHSCVCLFFSLYLQTLPQQSPPWLWCPLWKRWPSLRPLLRLSRPRLQREPGASETPDLPLFSKNTHTHTHTWFSFLCLKGTPISSQTSWGAGFTALMTYCIFSSTSQTLPVSSYNKNSR